jgi:hypothetical protein
MVLIADSFVQSHYSLIVVSIVQSFTYCCFFCAIIHYLPIAVFCFCAMFIIYLLLFLFVQLFTLSTRCCFRLFVFIRIIHSCSHLLPSPQWIAHNSLGMLHLLVCVCVCVCLLCICVYCISHSFPLGGLCTD